MLLATVVAYNAMPVSSFRKKRKKPPKYSEMLSVIRYLQGQGGWVHLRHLSRDTDIPIRSLDRYISKYLFSFVEDMRIGEGKPILRLIEIKPEFRTMESAEIYKRVRRIMKVKGVG